MHEFSLEKVTQREPPLGEATQLDELMAEVSVGVIQGCYTVTQIQFLTITAPSHLPAIPQNDTFVLEWLHLARKREKHIKHEMLISNSCPSY